MTESWKVRGYREYAESLNPGLAAERAAEQFERDAVAIPPVLVVADTDPPWKQRISSDAAYLYRTVVMAGEAGVRLTDVGTGLGRERATAALKLLRGSGTIRESRERLPDIAGHMRALVILRAPAN